MRNLMLTCAALNLLIFTHALWIGDSVAAWWAAGSGTLCYFCASLWKQHKPQ